MTSGSSPRLGAEKMTSYINLALPIRIGKHTYRNRIEAASAIFASLVLLPEPISSRVLPMIEDRAKGGCASMINGEISVNFNDTLRPVGTSADNWRKLGAVQEGYTAAMAIVWRGDTEDFRGKNANGSYP